MSQHAQARAWDEPTLRQAIWTLYRETARRSAGSTRGRTGEPTAVAQTAVAQTAIEQIVRLGMQPEVLAALRQREDPQEAIRDLCTRHAFAELMARGRSVHELDPLSSALIQATLETIYRRAAQVAARSGENPLDEEPNLLVRLCKCLSRYLPRKPMRAHITWKLKHYEGAVSRAMRQIEHLVTRPQVTPAFVDHVLQAALPEAFKAELLQLARGGGRAGLNYEAVIRFFCLPATVRLVKSYAGTQQTARTLYDEAEYHDVPWRGKRRLPKNRRQGYLDAALNSLERRREASLDTLDWDLHDTVAAPQTLGVAANASSATLWV